jgi:hypothetical protein
MLINLDTVTRFSTKETCSNPLISKPITRLFLPQSTPAHSPASADYRLEDKPRTQHPHPSQRVASLPKPVPNSHFPTLPDAKTHATSPPSHRISLPNHVLHALFLPFPSLLSSLHSECAKWRNKVSPRCAYLTQGVELVWATRCLGVCCGVFL